MDAEILKAVRALGRHPLEYSTPASDEQREESKLMRKIRNKMSKLTDATKSELERLRFDYGWTKEIEAMKARVFEADEKFAGGGALTRAELLRRLELMLVAQPVDVIKEEQYERKADATKRRVTDWWRNAGITIKPKAPAWCGQGQFKMPVAALHYDLSHQVLMDAEAFLSGVSPPAREGGPQRQLYDHFYASCRSPERRVLAPFPEHLDGQCRSGSFVPHQCLRQLALIELTESSYTDLPHDHGSLLGEVRRVRASEVSRCQVLSEVLEAAVERLVQYGGHSDRSYANGRFLDLKELPAQVGPGRRKGVETWLAAHSVARRLVERLDAALAEKGIDVRWLKPNHFATLSVYYDKFLRTDKSKPTNGLARWCFELRPYIRGDDIEREEDRREHLASRCLPRHYDDSGALQPPGLEAPCQAIAAAPVTCELCHQGLAGHDSLARHCSRKHVNIAEYRKRTFWKARKAGICPLLPWVKRNMAQSFQFFRIHSVPSSCNDWTARAAEKAELRREEACAVCAVKDWLEQRHAVYLFQEGTCTTTWQRAFYAAEDQGASDEESDAGAAEGGGHQESHKEPHKEPHQEPHKEHR